MVGFFQFIALYFHCPRTPYQIVSDSYTVGAESGGSRKEEHIFRLNGSFKSQFSVPWAWQLFRADPFSLNAIRDSSFFTGPVCRPLSWASHCGWCLVLTSVTPKGRPLDFCCQALKLLFLKSLRGTTRRVHAAHYSLHDQPLASKKEIYISFGAILEFRFIAFPALSRFYQSQTIISDHRNHT